MVAARATLPPHSGRSAVPLQSPLHPSRAACMLSAPGHGQGLALQQASHVRGLQTTRSVALAEPALDTKLHEEHRAALRSVKPKVHASP